MAAIYVPPSKEELLALDDKKVRVTVLGFPINHRDNNTAPVDQSRIHFVVRDPDDPSRVLPHFLPIETLDYLAWPDTPEIDCREQIKNWPFRPEEGSEGIYGTFIGFLKADESTIDRQGKVFIYTDYTEYIVDPFCLWIRDIVKIERVGAPGKDAITGQADIVWHREGVLATGPRPRTKADVLKLAEFGFSAIIALEDWPGPAKAEIYHQNFNFYRSGLTGEESADNAALLHIGKFIASHALRGYSVYLHAGDISEQADRVAADYLEYELLYNVSHITYYAPDLDSDDQLDCARAHAMFDGQASKRAIEMLNRASAADDPDLKELADRTLEIIRKYYPL